MIPRSQTPAYKYNKGLRKLYEWGWWRWSGCHRLLKKMDQWWAVMPEAARKDAIDLNTWLATKGIGYD